MAVHTAREDGAILGHTAKFVDVDGIRTRYYEVGEQNEKTLVLVHGSLFDGFYGANTWTRNLEGLGKRYHVFAADKLGSGLTDNPKSLEEYTQHAIVQHMHAFMQKVGVQQYSIAGQSNGAYTAARLALEHMDQCEALIISDSGTLGPPVGDMQERRAKLYQDMPDDPREALIARWSRLGYTTGDLTDEYLDTGMYMGNTPKALQTKADVKAAGSAADAGGTARGKDETLEWIKEGAVTVPVLLTWGYNDPSAILEIGQKTYDLFCQSTDRVEMHIFNHVGHFHFREIPDIWNNVVIGFLDSLQ